MKQNKVDFTIKAIFGPYVMTSITGTDDKKNRDSKKNSEILETVGDYAD